MILKKGGQSVYNNGFGIPYLESKALCLKQPYCTRDKWVNLTKKKKFVVQLLACEGNL